MSEDLFSRNDGRCILLASAEYLGQTLNLPPGARVARILWDDERKLFLIGIEGVAFGTVAPARVPEVDARVDHFQIHLTAWPVVGSLQGQAVPTLASGPRKPPDVRHAGSFSLGQKVASPKPPTPEEASDEKGPE